jgi:2-amino-4-hydroxy-6-hydroxymethyldihydropteridine diphosphokinase
MQAFVALGSNVGDRRAHLSAAIAALAAAGVTIRAASSVWETEPVDTAEPGWFLNMAIEIDTALGPLELLDVLLEIERRAGRTRSVRNAPRTLDLDLLAMDGLTVDHPRLVLPHPRMWERRFVLAPLAEIAPGLRNPRTGRTAAEEYACSARPGIVRNVGSLATC